MNSLPRSDSASQLPLFDAIEILIKPGCVALVDPIDADLAQFKWSISNGYAMRKRCTVVLHRIILERKINRCLLPGELVDHIDGDRLNNRRSNLRVATQSQNQFNRSKPRNNTSGFKGVSWKKSHKSWQAIIKVHGKHIHLGYFDIPEEAHAAYMKAACKYAGQYARGE